MSNRFEKCLRDAVIEEVEQYQLDDSDELWHSIKKSIIERKIIQRQTQKKSIRFPRVLKVTVSIAVLLLVSLLGISKQGDTKAFGSIFRSYFKELLGGSQENIKFLGPLDNPLQGEEITLDPKDIQIINTPNQLGYVETTLEELLAIYPYNLYVPRDVLFADLKSILYETFSEEHWNVLFNYEGGALDFSLHQERAPELTSFAVGYDNEDTEAYFLYANGIEYLVRQDRYNLIRVTWFQHGVKFTLFGNLTSDQAMAVSRSLIQVK